MQFRRTLRYVRAAFIGSVQNLCLKPKVEKWRERREIRIVNKLTAD